jgi:membrane associated rhomboid family serine protease
MLYFWIFGDNVEDRIGHLRFVIFYLACGVIAGLVQIYSDFDSPLPMIGASGAVSGILGAYLILYPRARVLVLIPILFFLRTAMLPAWLVLASWFLIQIIGIQSSPMSGSGGIAYFAHLSGFLAGILLLPIFKKGKR